MEGTVSASRQEGVATLRFNPPHVLDMPARAAMAAALEDFAADPNVRSIVICGGADLFVKGDLRMIADKDADALRALGLHHYWDALIHCPKPVIAAVRGLAWGAGCELALMCDVIVADGSAEFAQPESTLGVMPGAGGSQRLIRTIGKQMTSYLLMTGKPLSAERAFQLGLVCELAEDGEADAAALRIARHLAGQPPQSLANIKRMLAIGPDMPLLEAAAIEHETWLSMFGSEDQKEGMAAALSGRLPVFRGR